MGFQDDDAAPDPADLLRVVPRLYDRTRQQFALAQRMLGFVPCLLGGPTGADEPASVDPELAALPDTEERVDVLSVLREDEPADPPASADEPTPSEQPAPPPVETALGIQDYDSMAASQVVPRLTTLSADELDSVRRYEQAHRGRQTILNRVAQLLDD